MRAVNQVWLRVSRFASVHSASPSHPKPLFQLAPANTYGQFSLLNTAEYPLWVGTSPGREKLRFVTSNVTVRLSAFLPNPTLSRSTLGSGMSMLVHWTHTS